MFYINDYDFKFFILQMDQSYVTWKLPPFNNDYIYSKNLDRNEYYADLQCEWSISFE